MDDGIVRPDAPDEPEVVEPDDTAETMKRALLQVLRTTAIANEKRLMMATLEEEIEYVEGLEDAAMEQALRITRERGVSGTYILGERVIVVKPNEITVTDAMVLDVADAEQDSCGTCRGSGYVVKAPETSFPGLSHRVLLSAKKSDPGAGSCPSCSPRDVCGTCGGSGYVIPSIGLGCWAPAKKSNPAATRCHDCGPLLKEAKP